MSDHPTAIVIRRRSTLAVELPAHSRACEADVLRHRWARIVGGDYPASPLGWQCMKRQCADRDAQRVLAPRVAQVLLEEGVLDAALVRP